MKRNYEFDMAFSSFVDGKEYERTESTLFKLVLSAFTAGWKAAGGEELPKPDVISKYMASEHYFKIPASLKKSK